MQWSVSSKLVFSGNITVSLFLTVFVPYLRIRQTAPSQSTSRHIHRYAVLTLSSGTQVIPNPRWLTATQFFFFGFLFKFAPMTRSTSWRHGGPAQSKKKDAHSNKVTVCDWMKKGTYRTGKLGGAAGIVPTETVILACRIPSVSINLFYVFDDVSPCTNARGLSFFPVTHTVALQRWWYPGKHVTETGGGTASKLCQGPNTSRRILDTQQIKVEGSGSAASQAAVIGYWTRHTATEY